MIATSGFRLDLALSMAASTVQDHVVPLAWMKVPVYLDPYSCELGSLEPLSNLSGCSMVSTLISWYRLSSSLQFYCDKPHARMEYVSQLT
jgi:hypothetical protein